MKQRLPARLAWILGATAVGAIALELALRAAGFEHARQPAPIAIWNGEGVWELEPGPRLHAEDPDCLWAPRPGAPIPWGRGERVNEHGLRGPALPMERRTGALRIACLGDSTTFGFGVAWEESWCALLAEILEVRGQPAEVLCAGAIAHTARQGLARWRHRVRPFRPDVVVAAFGAVNEHHAALGGSDDQRIRQQRGSLGRALRDRSRILHLAAFLGERLRRGPGSERERWEARVERALAGARQARHADWPGTRRVSPAEMDAALTALDREVRATGACLILVDMPRGAWSEEVLPVLLRYTETVRAVARREGIPLFEARDLFRAREAAAAERGEPLFQANDAWHPTPAGHRLFAEGLARLVL